VEGKNIDWGLKNFSAAMYIYASETLNNCNIMNELESKHNADGVWLLQQTNKGFEIWWPVNQTILVKVNLPG